MELSSLPVTCPNYNGIEGIQTKYTHEQWYSIQAINYFKHNIDHSAKQLFDWLKTGGNVPWRFSTIERKSTEFRKLAKAELGLPNTLDQTAGKFATRMRASAQQINKIKQGCDEVSITSSIGNSNDSNVAPNNRNNAVIDTNNNNIDNSNVMPLNSTPANRSYNTLKQRANDIAPLLFNNNTFADILDILDLLSMHPGMPDCLSNLRIGQCVRAMQEMKHTLKTLSKRTDIESCKQKQTLLSSIAIIQTQTETISVKNDTNENKNDKNENKNDQINQIEMISEQKIVITNIRNRCFLYHLLNQHYNSRLMHKIEEIKVNFQKKLSLLLYSQSSLKTHGTYVNSQINDDIINFYHTNTDPSPSPFHTVYVYDQNGNKMRHPKHYLYGTLKSFYRKWQNDQHTIALIQSLNATMPSESHFRRLKPKYVKFCEQREFNSCTICENFGEMLQCWHRIMNAMCKCASEACNDCITNVNGQLQVCARCNACPIKHKQLNYPRHRILQDTLCDFQYSPKLDCIFGKCEGKRVIKRKPGSRRVTSHVLHPCGFKKLKSVFKHKKCHNFVINAEQTFSYYRWESRKFQTRDKKDLKHTIKVLQEQSWNDFMQCFEKLYWQYIFHETARRNQHHSRKMIT